MLKCTNSVRKERSKRQQHAPGWNRVLQHQSGALRWPLLLQALHAGRGVSCRRLRKPACTPLQTSLQQTECKLKVAQVAWPRQQRAARCSQGTHSLTTSRLRSDSEAKLLSSPAVFSMKEFTCDDAEVRAERRGQEERTKTTRCCCVIRKRLHISAEGHGETGCVKVKEYSTFPSDKRRTAFCLFLGCCVKLSISTRSDGQATLAPHQQLCRGVG